jgi:hypothetical protein
MTRGHAALAFVNVGVGFVDRTAYVLTVGFLRIYGFHISATVSPLDRYVVKGKLYKVPQSPVFFIRIHCAKVPKYFSQYSPLNLTDQA